MQRGLKEAAKKAGVALPARKAWHIFRRTWASMMLQAGCDVETLRVLGNWKTATMPLWYADAAGVDRQKELLERVPGLDAEGSNGTEMAQSGKVVNLSDWKKG
jgi:integrase